MYQLLELSNVDQFPFVRVLVHFVFDDLEVQVTSCRGASRSNLRDNLADPDFAFLLGGHP
jgi:hypothetical protein